MSGIKSSLTVAGSVSSSLSRTASALTAVQSPSQLADRTNVLGNSNAKRSGADLVSSLHKISNAIAKDGNNIHSVAKEFASIDQKSKRAFNGLSLGGRL